MGGYSDFCLLQKVRLCFGFKILNFAIFLGVSRFCQLVLWVCKSEQVFFGYVIFHRYFVWVELNELSVRNNSYPLTNLVIMTSSQEP